MRRKKAMKLSSKLLMFGFLAAAAAFLSLPVDASATTTMTATVTADNHYALYVGNADGSDLTYIGRNEDGVYGNPGEYNWSLPETYSGVSVTTGNYAYVLAWNDGGAQSLIGEFALSDGTTIVTNATDWEYSILSTVGSSLPDVSSIMSMLGSASWSSVAASAANGSGPWGTISGISSAAQFIWSDTLGTSSTSDGYYVVFRTELSPVPIPGAVWLFGSGLVGLIGFRKKRLA